MIQFDDEKTSPAIIKVVGVGGAGSNAVNRMIQAGLESVDFFVINTDEQALKASFATNKLVIGRKITNGLGAGGDPEVGLKAAREDKDKITKILEGADMVFVTAGMGGGTGTGAAPVVAEIAKSLGLLVVGVVTVPFSFEGKIREKNAKLGLEAIRQHVDTLIVIKNEQIFELIEPHAPVNVALKMLDDVLFNAVRGISDIINKPGIINVDFADVKNIMKSSGEAVLGFGEGIGDNKVKDAVSQALHNVLLENPDIRGATGILLNVIGGEDFSFYEWKEISEMITREVDPEANRIVGLTVDPSLKEKVKVIVIATGFKRKPISDSGYNFIIKQTKAVNVSPVDSAGLHNSDIPRNHKEIQKEPYPLKTSIKHTPQKKTEKVNQNNENLEDKDIDNEEYFQKNVFQNRIQIHNLRNENTNEIYSHQRKDEIVQKKNLQDIVISKRKGESIRTTESDIFELDYDTLQVPAYLRKKSN